MSAAEDAAGANPARHQESANPARGEAELRLAGEVLVLRPTFAALVAAEGELGPLMAVVERAAAGQLALGELVTLLWHCVQRRPPSMTRDTFGEAVVAGGLARVTPALKTVLRQVLAGR